MPDVPPFCWVDCCVVVEGADVVLGGCEEDWPRTGPPVRDADVLPEPSITPPPVPPELDAVPEARPERVPMQTAPERQQATLLAWSRAQLVPLRQQTLLPREAQLLKPDLQGFVCRFARYEKGL